MSIRVLNTINARGHRGLGEDVHLLEVDNLLATYAVVTQGGNMEAYDCIDGKRLDHNGHIWKMLFKYYMRMSRNKV